MEDTAKSPTGPTKPLSIGGMLGYSIASLGCGTFFALNNGVIPLFLKNLTSDARLIGLMASSHSYEGALIQPIVGALSDRCRSRFGRRRPFMLVFFPLSALFALLTPFASALPKGQVLAATVVGIFLMTVMFNIAFDPYQSLLPDITPEAQRGRVVSVWSLLGLMGQAGIMLAPAPANLKFMIVAVAMVATAVITCLAIKETPLGMNAIPRRRFGAELRQVVRGLAELRQAAKAICVSFFFGIGTGVMLPFLTVLSVKITGCDDRHAEWIFLIALATTAVFVLPCGRLTDRLSPRILMMASLALIGTATLLGYGAHTWTQIAVLMVIAGIGNAASSASIYPLITQLVPESEVGLYTGLQSMALSVLQPTTVLVTGEMINRGGYRVVFVVCAAAMFVGLVVAATIREKVASAEVAARLREIAA